MLHPGVSRVQCFPAVDQSFDVSYDYPITDLFGIVTNATTVYNYNKQLQLLPPPTPPSCADMRRDSYEPYVQTSGKLSQT